MSYLDRPHDSRMMAHPYPHPYPTSTHGPAPATLLKRPSFPGVAKQIYVRDGLRGFFRGLGPTFLRTFPANASALFVYEETMRILGAEKVFPPHVDHACPTNTDGPRHAAKLDF
jgi:solute carrier family 25 carnitine/acylcarnitine transporter 20/29